VNKKKLMTRREFGGFVGMGALSAAGIRDHRKSNPSRDTFALIGCGQRGRGCSDSFLSSSISVVCDTNIKRAIQCASRFRAAFTDDWRQCVENKTLAGVVVAVSEINAPMICRAALENGKQVLLDFTDARECKSLVTTVGDGALAEKGFAAVFPFSPVALAIKRLIEEGLIGAVRYCHGCCGIVIRQQEADIVMETHVRQLLLLLTVLDSGVRKNAHTICRKTQAEGGRFQSLLSSLELHDGIQLNITSTLENIVPAGIVIRGANGSIVYEDGCLFLFSRENGKQRIILPSMERTRIALATKWERSPENARVIHSLQTINDALKQTWT